MLEFQLFRIKIHTNKQTNFLEPQKERAEIIKEIINSLPSAEKRLGTIWHIGNITPLDNDGIYFRIGRISKSTVEVFKDGNFLDTESETAPNTHAFIDTKIELCAISKKPKLSPKCRGIANQLKYLLKNNEIAEKYKIDIEINDINDPEDFITLIKKAYSITKFWVSFERPNAFDVNEDFIKPNQKLVDEANAKTGKTQIEGDNLNPNILEELSRSAASTGNNAVAWLKKEEAEISKPKSIKGNPVIVSCEEISNDAEKKTFLGKIREYYNKIRGKVK